MNSTYSDTIKESKRIRAARGFHSFKEWARQNRQAAAEHRKVKPELSAALDREYDRYIKGNL
jgi:hypothetical protein